MIPKSFTSLTLLVVFCCVSFASDIEQVEVFDGFSNNIEVFVDNIVEFTEIDNSSISVPGAFTAFLDGKVVIAGGIKDDGSLSDLVYWFDISNPEVINRSHLREPVAFGGDYVKDERLYCLGGLTGNGASDGAFYLVFEDGDIRQYDADIVLPVSLDHLDAAYLNGYIFVAGGGNGFYVIDETAGQAYSYIDKNMSIYDPSVVAKNDAVYIIGGRDEAGYSLSSVYKLVYELVDGIKIKRLLDCSSELGVCAAAAIGQSHIFVASPLYENSPLLYHTITDSWVGFGKNAPQGDFDLVLKAGKDILFGGKSGVYRAVLQNVSSLMQPLDYVLIIVYLAALVGVGFYFSKRENSTENFFVGGRKVPTWAVAFSIFATGTSGISFMAIPAKAYMTNLLFFGAVLISVVFSLTLAFILPYLRNLEITSVYEYLEMRFDGFMRLAGATVCLVYQLGARMSVAMYIPAVALTAVTGIDIKISILVMGILATVYTVLGGIEAVIWSDVIQSIVMIGGAVVAVFILISGTTGGITGYIDLNKAYDKFKLFDMRWDYTLPVIWIMAANGFAVMIQTLTDQSMLQRVFCTKSAREARNSQLLSVLVAVSMAVIFWGIGTLLFSYFKSNPASLIPSLPDDSVFPLFIVKKIPVGLCGLVIAGLFSAAMSTLDSSMNTVSAVIVTDFYSKIRPQADEKSKMILARYSTLAVGIIGTVFALLLAASGVKSIFDVWMTLAALLLSALPAVMFLGLFTKRTGRAGAYTAMSVAVITSIFIKNTQLHFFAYGFVILFIAAVSGYAVSLVFKEKRDLKGLTFWY